MTSVITRTLVAVTLLLLIFGCASSSEPSVSGFGVGNSRVVNVGDEVVIRFPASDRTGQAKWRITEFDSALLRTAQRPRFSASGPNGQPEITVRFEARRQGITEVVLTRMVAGSSGSGEVGERRRFRINIRNR